jgi:hypothetical protein
MEISRRGPGEASLVLDGREMLDLLQAEASEEEYEALLSRLEALLRPAEGAPRVVLRYREGLFDAVGADLPLQAVLIEDDPYDDPPLALQRLPVAGDAAAVDAMLAAAERRLRLAARP